MKNPATASVQPYMIWKDTPHRFGLISVILHWVLAFVILGLFALGLYMVGLTYYDRWYQTAPNIHRSLGVIVGALMVFRVVWRAINIHPEAQGVSWERIAAKIVHHLSYLLIFAIIVSGYLISTAKGQPVAVFGWFEIPALISGIDNQEDIAGLVHELLAYGMVGLVGLHAAAALKHHFIDRDSTLTRMLGMRSMRE